MTPTPPTLPQAICLLALSRGQQPAYIAPVTRHELVRKRWATQHGTGGERVLTITEAGRRELATSPHLEAAQRKLDAGARSKPWQGL